MENELFSNVFDDDEEEDFQFNFEENDSTSSMDVNSDIGDTKVEEHTGSIEDGPFIPIGDGGYISNEIVKSPGMEDHKYTIEVPEKPKVEHEAEWWDRINEFESNSWSANNRGLLTGFKSIDDAFDGGLKSGFVIIGGDSNLGKSALMTQLAWGVATNNQDVYVMDFSLDDPMPDKMSRIIGCGSKVILNSVKYPNKYTQLPLMLARRKKGLNEVRKRTGSYRAFDSNDVSCIEEISAKVEETIIAYKVNNVNKKVVVFIDNFHDLASNTQTFASDKMKYDFLASWCADLAIEHDIPVICTAELKKINGIRRAGLDDLREAVKIKYEAKAVLLVYNEVHYKGEGSEIFFMRSNTQLKQPVFEVHFAKNKLSGYKGRLFFEFYPEMARLEESNDASSKHYASLVYAV